MKSLRLLLSCVQAYNGKSVSPKPLPCECTGDAIELNSTMEHPSLSDQRVSFFQDLGQNINLKSKIRRASCGQKHFSPFLHPISLEI